MNRDSLTGRFSKQDPQASDIHSTTINSSYFNYKAIIGLLMLLYPWLVILFNNSTRIASLFNKFNTLILENIHNDANSFK